MFVRISGLTDARGAPTHDAHHTMTRRRILLLGVAALLSASALLAIAILLAGRFGGTQQRIIGTTALLAGYGVVALPGAILLDQGRRRALAAATIGLSGLGAALALASVWGRSGSETLGKSVGTATLLAVATAQAAALAARRQAGDPALVRRAFAASCATAAATGAAGTALLWTQPGSGTYPRLLGALVVLDLLLVALQPLLARARPVATEHRLRIVLASGETLQVAIEGGDLASAAAKAIRAAERSGARVARLEVGGEARTRT
jgi:hypothetical protein